MGFIIIVPWSLNHGLNNNSVSWSLSFVFYSVPWSLSHGLYNDVVPWSLRDGSYNNNVPWSLRDGLYNVPWSFSMDFVTIVCHDLWVMDFWMEWCILGLYGQFQDFYSGSIFLVAQFGDGMRNNCKGPK